MKRKLRDGGCARGDRHKGRRLRVEGLEDRRLLAADVELIADLDTTAATQLLAPQSFVTIGDVAYFTGLTPTHGRELWRTDGTAAGTYLLRDINMGQESSNLDVLTAVGDRLYFTASDGVTPGEQLWTSDGTPEGTHLVKAIGSASGGPTPVSIGALGDTVYFVVWGESDSWEMWQTTGEEASTSFIMSLGGSLGSYRPQNFTTVGDTLYFTADDGIHGAELWKTDGTAVGAMLVSDIRVGEMGSQATNLFEHNGALYFTATDGISGLELWRTTADGAVQVRDILTGSQSSTPRAFQEIGGWLYFLADDGLPSLFRTDGTAAGTVEISDARAFAEFQDSLFVFTSDSIFTGNVDGTNLQLVADVSPAGLGKTQPVVAGDFLYFVGGDDEHGAEVWVTDGTADGTGLLKDTVPGPMSPASGSIVLELAALGDKVVFGSIRDDLWISDGSQIGTFRARGNPAGTGSGHPRQLVDFKGSTNFLANDSALSRGLWKTDGASPPVLVRQLGGRSEQSVDFMSVVGDRLYFTYDSDGALWQSDGTTEGTRRVTGFEGAIPYNGSLASTSSNLAGVNGELFFVVETLELARELWKTDGTEAGTVRIQPETGELKDARRLLAVGDRLHLSALTKPMARSCGSATERTPERRG